VVVWGFFHQKHHQQDVDYDDYGQIMVVQLAFQDL